MRDRPGRPGLGQGGAAAAVGAPPGAGRGGRASGARRRGRRSRPSRSATGCCGPRAASAPGPTRCSWPATPGCRGTTRVAAARAFYAARGLPAWAQVVVGSPEDLRATADGWAQARPGRRTRCCRSPRSPRPSARRATRRSADRSEAPPPGVSGELNEQLNGPGARISGEMGGGWLATDERARERPEAARAVLEGPGPGRLRDPRARRRGGGPGPGGDARGRRLGRASPTSGSTPSDAAAGWPRSVLGALLPWAAERGREHGVPPGPRGQRGRAGALRAVRLRHPPRLPLPAAPGLSGTPLRSRRRTGATGAPGPDGYSQTTLSEGV